MTVYSSAYGLSPVRTSMMLVRMNHRERSRLLLGWRELQYRSIEKAILESRDTRLNSWYERFIVACQPEYDHARVVLPARS